MDAVQAGFLSGYNATPVPPKAKGKFTILFTGDFHSHLEPSAIRIAHYIEKCRRTIGHPLLVLDAGDFLQGTLYFEKFKGKAEVEFMNHAGYSIITVGNHDLDNGIDHLQSLLNEGKFTTVCANIFREGKACFPPYSSLSIGGVRVAVVGIMGNDAWQSIRPSMRANLTLEDPSTTLDKLLPEIRPQVDVIILLSHSGIKQDRIFAQSHPLVDIIIGGHSHTLMQQHEQYRHISVFHGSSWGSLMGKMDVEATDNGVSTQSSIEYMDERFDVLENQETVASVVALVARCKLEVESGYNEVLLDCPISLSADEKRDRLTPLGAAVCEVLRKAGDADVAVMPSGSIKTAINAGPLTVKHVHELLAHKESLWVVHMKGSLLLQIFEDGQKRWGQQRQFQYSGITLEIEGAAIRQVQIQQKPIDANAVYKIAGPSFFFEREIMDLTEVKPAMQQQVSQINVIAEDLRVAFTAILRSEGLNAIRYI